jgi:hypothetical protein
LASTRHYAASAQPGPLDKSVHSLPAVPLPWRGPLTQGRATVGCWLPLGFVPTTLLDTGLHRKRPI